MQFTKLNECLDQYIKHNTINESNTLNEGYNNYNYAKESSSCGVIINNPTMSPEELEEFFKNELAKEYDDHYNVFVDVYKDNDDWVLVEIYIEDELKYEKIPETRYSPAEIDYIDYEPLYEDCLKDEVEYICKNANFDYEIDYSKYNIEDLNISDEY